MAGITFYRSTSRVWFGLQQKGTRVWGDLGRQKDELFGALAMTNERQGGESAVMEPPTPTPCQDINRTNKSQETILAI